MSYGSLALQDFIDNRRNPEGVVSENSYTGAGKDGLRMNRFDREVGGGYGREFGGNSGMPMDDEQMPGTAPATSPTADGAPGASEMDVQRGIEFALSNAMQEFYPDETAGVASWAAENYPFFNAVNRNSADVFEGAQYGGPGEYVRSVPEGMGSYVEQRYNGGINGGIAPVLVESEDGTMGVEGRGDGGLMDVGMGDELGATASSVAQILAQLKGQFGTGAFGIGRGF
jgi:hypothetical protein|tara:strand:- start:18206 stop:18889 length:684 start_codon:yes stop_codon:yes gene_type:complete